MMFLVTDRNVGGSVEFDTLEEAYRVACGIIAWTWAIQVKHEQPVRFGYRECVQINDRLGNELPFEFVQTAVMVKMVRGE